MLVFACFYGGGDTWPASTACTACHAVQGKARQGKARQGKARLFFFSALIFWSSRAKSSPVVALPDSISAAAALSRGNIRDLRIASLYFLHPSFGVLLFRVLFVSVL